MKKQTDLSFARFLDLENPLSEMRNRFHIMPGVLYMDGNSLGLCPVDAMDSIKRVVDEWSNLGINGWLNAKRPWFYFSEQMGAMASKLVGADENEVVMTGTTTINIHSLVSTFFRPKGKKKKILADALNFPSDLYALQGQLKLHNLDAANDLVLIEPGENGLLDEQSIINAMDQDIALIFLPSVLYRSGQLLNIELLASAAKEKGIVIGIDCSHSVGAIPHNLSKWGVDFAVWCSYKYLNAGPGAPAFLYVNKKHFGKEPLLAGWFGCKKDRQFEMETDFIPESHAGAWQVSSPGIIGASPLESSLKILLEAGVENIREQSLKLTDYLIYLLDERVLSVYEGFRVITPAEPNRRGGHVAFSHAQAFRINEALKSTGVIPDFRPPDIIRVAPVALYNTFEEVWLVVDKLLQIMKTCAYERFSAYRKPIT